MENSAARVTPLFRSDAQARLLASTFLGKRDRSLTELSRETDLPLTTVHREIDRLERAGVVTSHRIGNVRMIKPNEDLPYYRELESLLLKTAGPAAVLRNLLARVPGIDRAYLFGSWARLYRGRPGFPPRDLDLLVVGDASPASVYEACRAAEGELGIAIDATVLTNGEWERSESGFLQAVKKGPLVTITEPA